MTIKKNRKTYSAEIKAEALKLAERVGLTELIDNRQSTIDNRQSTIDNRQYVIFLTLLKMHQQRKVRAKTLTYAC